MENKTIRELKCPMCNANMEYKMNNNTHIYTRTDCPIVAMEYFNATNLTDLTDYLK